MTQQQERITQAKHHEDLAEIWLRSAKLNNSLHGRAYKLGKFYQRQARNNRRAHKAASS